MYVCLHTQSTHSRFLYPDKVMTSFLVGGSQHFWDTILSFSFLMILPSVMVFGEYLTRHMGSWCLRKQKYPMFFCSTFFSLCVSERERELLCACRLVPVMFRHRMPSSIAFHIFFLNGLSPKLELVYSLSIQLDRLAGQQVP